MFSAISNMVKDDHLDPQLDKQKCYSHSFVERETFALPTGAASVHPQEVQAGGFAITSVTTHDVALQATGGPVIYSTLRRLHLRS